MKLKLMGGGVVALVVITVLFPAVVYILIGALVTSLVAVIYIVKTGLTGDGERKRIKTEVHRQARGIALRRALVRREAAHLAAVEAEKDQL